MAKAAVSEIDENFPYGLDRPKQARGFAGFGFALGLAALILTVALGIKSPAFFAVLALIVAALSSFVIGARMMRTSRIGKVHAADRMLDSLNLRGDESAVDLGCGNGLLCAGLAVRLPEGKVVGVDAWIDGQLMPSSKPLARKSLYLAGVKGVRIIDGSIVSLPLDDKSVDLAVSRDSFALVPGGKDQRAAAISDLARVVKPGGTVALLEPRVGGELAQLLSKSGFEDVNVSGRWWKLMPPHRLITARRSIDA